MNKKNSFLLFLVGMLSLVLIACSSSGVDSASGESGNSNDDDGAFPGETVRMIIPWGNGGNADVFARYVASQMEKNIDQSTVVENQTGAGGEVAITNYALEQPDYHNLLTTSAANFALTPQYKDVQYSEEHFKPVVGSFFTQFVLMVNPEKTGIETLEELVEYGKDKTIKYGSTSGPGGDTYTIQTALFKEMGVNAENVVFDGGQELVNNLLGGHVDVTVAVQPLADQYFQNGELVPLATFSPDLYELEGIEPVLPLVEQGFDIEYRSLNFVNAPADTPDEVINAIYDEFIKVYESDSFKEYIEKNGFVVAPMTGEEISQFIQEQKSDMERLLKTIEGE